MFKQLYHIVKSSVDIENATIDAIFSSSKEDRHGDVVEQEFDVRAFNKNPVILNSHNYNDAVEVIGKASDVKIENGKLQGKIKFAVAENPKAKVIFDLYAGGFLNAFSIGFIPTEFAEDDFSKILKSELLEVSAVSVPANPEALAKIKSKGIDLEILYDTKNKSNNIPNESNAKDNGEGTADNGDDSEAGGEDADDADAGDGGDDKTESTEKSAEKKELVGKWDEADTMIFCKVRDVAEFDEGSFRKITLKASQPKIKANIATIADGDTKMIQSLIFSKEEGWTIDDAKKWFSANDAMIETWTRGGSQRSTTDVTVRAINHLVDEKKQQDSKRKKILRIAVRAIDALTNERSETRSSAEVVEENSILSKAVRGLLKEKKLNKKGN